MCIFYRIVDSDANGGLVPRLVEYCIANKSKQIWRLMTKKLSEWYPAFTVVETREDGTTNKFFMIADVEKGIFEAHQEHPDLSQFFCHNH